MIKIKKKIKQKKVSKFVVKTFRNSLVAIHFKNELKEVFAVDSESKIELRVADVDVNKKNRNSFEVVLIYNAIIDKETLKHDKNFIGMFTRGFEAMHGYAVETLYGDISEGLNIYIDQRVAVLF